MSFDTERPWLRRYTKFVVLGLFFLIFMGGRVKSHEAGLSVPDWPTTFGENMFLFAPSKWVGGIAIEHAHRLVGSFIGLISLILAAWLAIVEKRLWVKILGYVLLSAVIVQGILGGLTVIFLLPAPISVTHGVLAQTIFTLSIIIAYSFSREREARRLGEGHPEGTPLAPGAFFVVGLVYVQLILGALMRHTEAGLAIPDFPTMAGGFLPWFDSGKLAWINDWRFEFAFETGRELPAVTLGQVWIHFAHRLGALCVSVGIAVLTAKAFRVRKQYPAVWKTVCMLVGLVAVQVALGASTIWTHRAPLVATVHVLTGAAVLGLSVFVALRACPIYLRDKTKAMAGVQSSSFSP